MAKFEFPQNPGTQRDNPFEDAEGKNPFSDGPPRPDKSAQDQGAGNQGAGDKGAGDKSPREHPREQSPPSATGPDNLFATSASSAGSGPPHAPGNYDAILVANPRGALRLAILGTVTSGLGVLGAGLGILGAGNWSWPLLIVLPVQFAALAAAIPACIIARRDLRAIKAGAMSDAGRRTSRFALLLGSGGVILGILPAVLYLALLVASLL